MGVLKYFRINKQFSEMYADVVTVTLSKGWLRRTLGIMLNRPASATDLRDGKGRRCFNEKLEPATEGTGKMNWTPLIITVTCDPQN